MTLCSIWRQETSSSNILWSRRKINEHYITVGTALLIPQLQTVERQLAKCFEIFLSFSVSESRSRVVNNCSSACWCIISSLFRCASWSFSATSICFLESSSFEKISFALWRPTGRVWQVLLALFQTSFWRQTFTMFFLFHLRRRVCCPPYPSTTLQFTVQKLGMLFDLNPRRLELKFRTTVFSNWGDCPTVGQCSCNLDSVLLFFAATLLCPYLYHARRTCGTFFQNSLAALLNWLRWMHRPMRELLLVLKKFHKFVWWLCINSLFSAQRQK